MIRTNIPALAIILGVAFGCNSSKLTRKASPPLNETISLKILSVDTMAVEYYALVNFSYPVGKSKGVILAPKRFASDFSADQFIETKLCPVRRIFSIDSNGDTLSYSGEYLKESKFYDDGKVVLDLADDAKIRAYNICGR